MFNSKLNPAADEARSETFFGRDITELPRVARILSQKRKANPVLVGEPGVGKTGIVEISMPALIAGTKYRGEFEERLQAVIKKTE